MCTIKTMKTSNQELFQRFNLHLSGEWTDESLKIVNEGCERFFQLAPQRTDLWFWTEQVTLKLVSMTYGGLTRARVILFNPKGLSHWTVVHELAHAWDMANGWSLSARMARFTHSRFPAGGTLHRLFPTQKAFWYQVGSPPPPCGVNKMFNSIEDFAETVTAYVYPDVALKKAEKNGFAYSKYGYETFYDTPRGKWLESLLN